MSRFQKNLIKCTVKYFGNLVMVLVVSYSVSAFKVELCFQSFLLIQPTIHLSKIGLDADMTIQFICFFKPFCDIFWNSQALSLGVKCNFEHIIYFQFASQRAQNLGKCFFGVLLFINTILLFSKLRIRSSEKRKKCRRSYNFLFFDICWNILFNDNTKALLA